MANEVLRGGMGFRERFRDERREPDCVRRMWHGIGRDDAARKIGEPLIGILGEDTMNEERQLAWARSFTDIKLPYNLPPVGRAYSAWDERSLAVSVRGRSSPELPLSFSVIGPSVPARGATRFDRSISSRALS